LINIILCGGSGTRLWPISRTLMPKQFVKLFENKSLFQLTLNRNMKVCDSNLVVSNNEQYFLALDQITELYNETESSKFLLEPVGRNTAPAIALACMSLNPETIVFVTPSDHLIKDEIEYEKVVIKAKKLAEENNLVTFGIRPSYPETGFGYIEADGINVKSFKEKPDEQTAKRYIDAGNYYWNSGIFMFKAGLFLNELRKYSPEIYTKSLFAFENKLDINNTQFKIKMDDMLEIPEDSIDYAVMEKSDIVKVIPSSIGWSDLGSFESLGEEVKSSADIININSEKNLVLSNKQVAMIDIDNLIVVDTPDALLISKKGSSQKVKQVVEQLKKADSDLTKLHTLVHRPWGTYEVLLSSDKYKLKKIVVQPGKRLSLQKHFKRSEHWVVVSGIATVRVGDEIKEIRKNESTYIKIGELHRLSNESDEAVVMIEAQVGDYTGEDDIVRLEDDYYRGN